MNTDSTPCINFYILPDSDLQRRLLFVYRLVEKAHAQQLKTLIIGVDTAQLAKLDRLIWTAQPASFIAHEILTDSSNEALPDILLTDNLSYISRVNFSPQVVIDLSYDATPLNFAKIMLVANQHGEILPNARMKYQAYVNQGIKPNVYPIGQAK